jgi:5-(aminomethyl)-3-furanmethanol phosphate kinase
MRNSHLTVVKLGGSHAASPHLRERLAAIVRGAGGVVLVPGGGPFADAVRDAQPVMGFDDRAAHRMALLAMEQYGHALAALEPRLVPAATAAAIRRAVRGRRVPVWLPFRMSASAPDVAATWDVTSDSLAAWLACRLGARRLVLVKRIGLNGVRRADELSASGVIDPALPGLLRAGGLEAVIVGGDELAAAGEAFAHGAAVGVRIEWHERADRTAA